MKTLAFGVMLLIAAPASAWDGERFAICNLGADGAAEAVLRTEPRADAAKVMTLAPGTHFEAVHPDPKNGWREGIVQEAADTVSYSEPEGWVHMDFLCWTVP